LNLRHDWASGQSQILFDTVTISMTQSLLRVMPYTFATCGWRKSVLGVL
jgi:hypothetical protein